MPEWLWIGLQNRIAERKAEGGSGATVKPMLRLGFHAGSIPARASKMPRQLITDQQEEPDDLPALTPQQQEFVRHILGGKSASDAYREAYDTSSMKQNTVWAEASRLRNNPSVAAWLAAARKANLGVAVLTKEAHLQELERLRELAVEKGNLGAAVQAEQIRGKVAGHQVDRIQEVPADADDPHKTLDKIAAEQGADKAIQLAQIAGITTWQPQTDTRH